MRNLYAVTMSDGQQNGNGREEPAGRGSASYQSRAPRFPIQTSVQYRESGEQDWHEGKSINISRTGILFEAEGDQVLQAMLEMRILFPAEVTGESPTNVVCWGPVVRQSPPSSPEGHPTVAASILRYRFRHD